ncbi:MAG: calcium/sodium antiporter [Halobacteriales archaeon]
MVAVPAPLLDLALVAVAIVGIGAGASQFVGGAARVAAGLGVSGLVVGLTVVGFGTTAPEFAVTLEAALTGKGDISVANVVGSNVINLGFVLGGAALVRSLSASGGLLRRDTPVLFGATALSVVVIWDLRIARIEGAVLFALLGGYLAVLARANSERVRTDEQYRGEPRWTDALRLLGGLALIIGSAHLLVESAVALARNAGVSEWVIGETVVALGTSAPEIVTSFVAVKRGRGGISAGNLVGSSIFNLLGVLGLAAVVRPLSVDGAAIGNVAWLLALVAVVTVFFWSRAVLTRTEGAVLVAINAARWLVDFLH